MGQRIGGLDRTLDFVTGGVLDGKESRERQLAFSSFHEAEQQVRVPIEGVAASGWAHADQAVNFLYPFLWAPAEREVPFATPHFSHGAEMGEEGSESLIIVHAAIVKWEIDEQSWVTGATVRMAVMAPGEAEVPYKATVHLTFQGLVAETEAPGEDA